MRLKIAVFLTAFFTQCALIVTMIHVEFCESCRACEAVSHIFWSIHVWSYNVQHGRVYWSCIKVHSQPPTVLSGNNHITRGLHFVRVRIYVNYLAVFSQKF